MCSCQANNLNNSYLCVGGSLAPLYFNISSLRVTVFRPTRSPMALPVLEPAGTPHVPRSPLSVKVGSDRTHTSVFGNFLIILLQEIQGYFLVWLYHE